MKYLIIALLLIGCSREEYDKENAKRWQIKNGYENELRVGNKLSDPFNVLILKEEDASMSKYVVYEFVKFESGGLAYSGVERYITVKNGVIVSVWRGE